MPSVSARPSCVLDSRPHTRSPRPLRRAAIVTGVIAGCVLALGVLGRPPRAAAQGAVETSAPLARTFGTSDLVVHTIPALAFVGSSSDFTPVDYPANTFGTDAFGSRYCTGTAVCALRAPVMLPAGAQVIFISLEACDDSTTGLVQAQFTRTVAPAAGVTNFSTSVDTGQTEKPGCVNRSANLPAPHTIDNVNNSYNAVVIMSNSPSLNSTMRFQAMRIFYRLQVSPAPATATFADVPTNHPFFRFIEALVDAGITTGCQTTPLLYCPDNFVTRAQMAAFISRALGLHWVQ